MGRHYPVFHGGGVYHASVIHLPGNGIAVFAVREYSLICCVSGHSHNVRRPAGEYIGLLIGILFFRIRMRRHCPVFHGGGVYHASVIHLPGDGITSPDRRVGGRIHSSARRSGDFGCPSRKGICILLIFSFKGRFFCIYRHSAMFHLTALQHFPILIHKSDRVFIGFKCGAHIHVSWRHDKNCAFRGTAASSECQAINARPFLEPLALRNGCRDRHTLPFYIITAARSVCDSHRIPSRQEECYRAVMQPREGQDRIVIEIIRALAARSGVTVPVYGHISLVVTVEIIFIGFGFVIGMENVILWMIVLVVHLFKHLILDDRVKISTGQIIGLFCLPGVLSGHLDWLSGHFKAPFARRQFFRQCYLIGCHSGAIMAVWDTADIHVHINRVSCFGLGDLDPAVVSPDLCRAAFHGNAVGDRLKHSCYGNIGGRHCERIGAVAEVHLEGRGIVTQPGQLVTGIRAYSE